uniref:Ig-like domain-containing protein n=1 Tax=Stegastes partitus TaxID=144197 RepID=A0A3B5B0W3_9TELE
SLQKILKYSLNTVVCLSQLLLLHFATQSHLLIQADCNENASLSCPGVSSQMNFLAVAWYKVNKLGIIRIRKSDGRITPYNLSRNASFGHDYSLLMPRVKPEDSGTYECALTANVGGQNLYHQIQLMVQVTALALNATHPNQLCDKQIEDLPVLWTTIGYIAVALVKIIVSLISIWVNMLFYSSSHRMFSSL